MRHCKEESRVSKFFKHLYSSYIPNSKDNLKQIIIKVVFLVSLVTLITSTAFIADYFIAAQKQITVTEKSRTVWKKTEQVATQENTDPYSEAKQQMVADNSDFKGWITINGTKVDNPIYQTKDNEYYLNHNQQKKKSVYGALFFDCTNVITEQKTDKNLIVYGHQMKNGSMFGSLKKYKSLSFYKENPTIKFSTLYKNSTYKIYAVILLNAVKEDDNGYIYNIAKQSFSSVQEFNDWRDEAYARSVIETGVDVEIDDNIITLVTCSSDFENARLVIMARETRAGESETVDTSIAKVNVNAKYPEKWYAERN